MGAWAGKFVIGLTGNIGTGKSVVRKMLEHLGAYGIDADALSHRTIAQGAPGYQPVLEAFGKWVLGPDGQIDRQRLARIVFSDPEGLVKLESIIHPLVGQAVDVLVRRATQKVIAVEAIKLLEAGLAARCDSIWVVVASPEVQIARLVQKRGMDEAAARQRSASQSPQATKAAAAKVIIKNDGSFENTWKQVAAAWQELFPNYDTAALKPVKPAARGELSVERARPRQASEVAQLINRLSRGQKALQSADIMAAFGEKAYLVLKLDGQPVGVAGWKVENLVARTDDIYLDVSLDMPKAYQALLQAIERASRELQCEISLLFLPSVVGQQPATFSALGYQVRTVQSLGVRAWQEAALESMPAGAVMLFKQLRQDRVLRPV
jgi:dephospho-CoA kinase